MPKRLLARCKPDSIDEFKLAAHQRYNDGLILSLKGRRTAAIYVWGYAIEMTLKAAYFSFLGKGLGYQLKAKTPTQSRSQPARVSADLPVHFIPPYVGSQGLHDVITWRQDLQPAIQTARSYAIHWPSQGAGHNLLAWAELLIAYRSHRHQAYSPAFCSEFQRKAQQSYQLWRETLRYHKNIAYLFEVRQMEDCTQWFICNDRFL